MKKRINLTALFILFGLTFVAAQTNKGDRLIGGSASLTINENTNINISSNMGWFLKDQLAVGGYFSYNYYKSGSIRNNGFSLGPLVRYYFNGEGNLRYFTYGSIGFELNRNKDEDHTESYNSLKGSVGFGIAYFITNQVAIDVKAGYNIENIASNLNTQHRFGLSIGFQIHLIKE